MLGADRILRTLQDHDVEYVLIGAFAATIHGSTLRTEDVDVCPDGNPANLRRLAGALTSLEAREFDPHKGEPVDRVWNETMLGGDDTWILTTPFGRLDLVFVPSGTAGYDDLARSAIEVDVDGVRVLVASLQDVIRSKEAANRPRDREQLPTLRRLLDLSGGE